MILIDYDNSGYGYRAWDLLYFMSNWNYDFSRDDVVTYLYAYIDAQTYSPYLTIEILLDEFKHHEPYFWLERLLFLMVKFSNFDLSRPCHDRSMTCKGLYNKYYFKSIEDKESDMIWYQLKYENSLKKFGRDLELSNSCHDLSLSILLVLFLHFFYL